MMVLKALPRDRPCRFFPGSLPQMGDRLQVQAESSFREWMRNALSQHLLGNCCIPLVGTEDPEIS